MKSPRQKREDALRDAYNLKDDVAFEEAINAMAAHEESLHQEIVMYRDALNEIAWPKDTINGPLPRKIAIRALDISTVGQRLKKMFANCVQPVEVKP